MEHSLVHSFFVLSGLDENDIAFLENEELLWKVAVVMSWGLKITRIAFSRFSQNESLRSKLLKLPKLNSNKARDKFLKIMS